jgi:DNA repair protein SbcD/Mre11
MKFLHTADWHIGKILHKQELHEDISLFFNWLEHYISDKKVDVLLVSGDIFDLANPSNRDTALYYNFLRRLSLTGVHTVITGGNHDSVSLLNAPAGLLKALNITVIGGVPDEFDNQLVPIYDQSGKLCAVVLAVPFLRDRDLRLSVSADEAIDKAKIIPKAIKQHYDRLVETARTLYGDVPLIGMGHLFMQGSVISDSERDIHLGNLMGLERKMISDDIQYMALGHIHKPQRIDKQDHIRYSGSPIYLDFSEAGYEKTIIEVDIDKNGGIKIYPIKLPKFRHLLRLKGSLAELRDKIFSYDDDNLLPAFVELDIIEDAISPAVVYEMQALETPINPKCIIVKSKIAYRNNLEVQNAHAYSQTIANLSPHDIINIRLQDESVSESTKEDLKVAYNQILDSFLD